jgi:hypothetical protein
MTMNNDHSEKSTSAGVEVIVASSSPDDVLAMDREVAQTIVTQVKQMICLPMSKSTRSKKEGL